MTRRRRRIGGRGGGAGGGEEEEAAPRQATGAEEEAGRRRRVSRDAPASNRSRRGGGLESPASQTSEPRRRRRHPILYRNLQDQDPPCADVMLINTDNKKMQSPQDQKDPCADVMLVSKEVVPKADDEAITVKCYTVVDIQKLDTNANNKSSEGEKPTELNPKDKGVFNFLKAVSYLLCGVINPLNVASFALMGSAGYPTISNSQKDCILLGSAIFLPFSIITCGVVHALEGRASYIDLATTMVIAEFAYVFLVICLDAMFFAEAPWFIILLGLFVWIVLAGWLVQMYGRPKGLYTTGLRVVKRVRFKSYKQHPDEAMSCVSSTDSV